MTSDIDQNDIDQDDPASLRRKVSFLSRRETYVPAPENVIVRETHMSWVFMAGHRVYKLKKPVRLPYLDFSTLERRAAAANAEVTLNRRLAPDVYLGVAPLTITPQGYAIGAGGTVVDWLVVMRRLDESQTLEAALGRRDVPRVRIRQLAEILTCFYSRAPRLLLGADSYLSGLNRAILADRRLLLGGTFDLRPGRIQRIVNIQHRFLQQRRPVLASRIHRRLILDGHGDLRPEHIWLGGSYPIIDCLEFNAALRAGDALDEFAFLHLECERLGGVAVGDTLRRQLAVVLNDDPASGLFLFYRIGRAMLRARLSIAHLADTHVRTPDKWPRLAQTYLTLVDTDVMALERLLDRDGDPSH